MIKAFTDRAWEDYQYWIKSDKGKLRKLTGLVDEAVRTPGEGTGRPKALKGKLEGYWSRRIDQEHRLAYKVVMMSDGAHALLIAQCRHHYQVWVSPSSTHHRSTYATAYSLLLLVGNQRIGGDGHGHADTERRLSTRRRRVGDAVEASSEDALLLGQPEDVVLEHLAVGTRFGAYGLPLGARFGPDIPQLVADGLDLGPGRTETRPGWTETRRVRRPKR